MSKVQMEEEKDDTLGNFNKAEKPSIQADYFNNFQKNMLSHVGSDEKKKNEKPITFNIRYLYYTVGIAAAVALVFLFINNFGGSETSSAGGDLAEGNKTEQIDLSVSYCEYVEENLSDFDTDEIIEMLAANGISLSNESVDLSQVSDAEVEAYLLEEYNDLEGEIEEEL